MMKTCPKCSASVSSDAWLCSCGYEFSGSEPVTPDPAQNTSLRPTRIPILTTSAVLTLLAAVITYIQVKPQITRLDFGSIVFTLALAFLGFSSLLFCIQLLTSSGLPWTAKLLSIIFIALGVTLLACSIVFGGCSTGIFRFRMNN